MDYTDCTEVTRFDDDLKKAEYQRIRTAHWDRVAARQTSPGRPSAYYHRMLQRFFQFFVPPGMRVLELGCGNGDLLASLRPAVGVGLDFSRETIGVASERHSHLLFIRADAHDLPIRVPFDFIILSDLVNDLWNVQRVFEELKPLTHPGTRVILNFFNNLWRVPLGIVKRLGLGAETLEQNWFSPHDVANLLALSDFEIIQRRPFILLPVRIPFLTRLCNRYLLHLVPFTWFVMTNLIVARPAPNRDNNRVLPKVSVIIPARNEEGNIDQIVRRVPQLGQWTELVFVEGQSSDDTYLEIKRVIEAYPEKRCRVYRQSGRGKGDAVRLGFDNAEGDILMILDADMTVAPEDLNRFLRALVSGKGEFINGVRLIYPLEDESMRFFNILGNKFFSLAFSWLLGQPLKDTLCGTKVLRKRDYELIARNREYFGNFDPFGDFDLLFGAAKLNLKIAEMPIRYRARTYGRTNIDRWRHGWLLVKMVLFAARRIKFIYP